MNGIRLENLKTVVEIFAFFAGIAYALGFLVVNSYLISYGTVEFEILRLKYIATGLLVLSLMLIYTAISLPRIQSEIQNSYIFFDELFEALRDVIWFNMLFLILILYWPSREKSWVISPNISETLFGILYFILFLFPFSTMILKKRSWFQKIFRVFNIISSLGIILLILIFTVGRIKYLLIWSAGYFWFLVIIFSAPNSKILTQNVTESSKRNILKFKSNLSRYALGFVVIILLLLSFGHYIYPELSPVIGGGKYISAELIPHSEKGQEFRRLVGDGKVKIIDQTSDYYFVLQNSDSLNKNLIQINKSLVAGIKFNNQ